MQVRTGCAPSAQVGLPEHLHHPPPTNSLLLFSCKLYLLFIHFIIHFIPLRDFKMTLFGKDLFADGDWCFYIARFRFYSRSFTSRIPIDVEVSVVLRSSQPCHLTSPIRFGEWTSWDECWNISVWRPRGGAKEEISEWSERGNLAGESAEGAEGRLWPPATGGNRQKENERKFSHNLTENFLLNPNYCYWIFAREFFWEFCKQTNYLIFVVNRTKYEK